MQVAILCQIKSRPSTKAQNIEQAFSSSYHNQSNRQVEVCINFEKCTLKKCFDSRSDPHIALLQIHMIPLGQELSSPATMLFNHPIIGRLPVINRPPVGIDNDQEHYEVIVKRQTKDDKSRYTPKGSHRVYCSSSMRGWGTVDPWHNRRER